MFSSKQTVPLNDKHIVLHPPSPEYFFQFLLYSFLPCVFIPSANQPGHSEAYLPNTRASLPRLSPAINQQQGWRGQTEEPTQPAQWLPQSIIIQKISIIADGWLVWLAAGLAKQAHFRAVWSASPTALKQTGGGWRIWKEGFGDLVLK